MKEKGDECIFVGYSTQSRAYRVFNKRTRVIMESIHVNFDELPQMASEQISSNPAPECQTMALDHDSLSPERKCQENVSHRDKTVTTLNELDFLFSPMFDELVNGHSQVVSKSSAVSVADAPNQRQQYSTPLNNHTTPSPTCQIPSIAPTVISSENINQAETNDDNDQVTDDEFINVFSTPVQDQGKTSNCHSVRTRRQLESDAEMCMFALTDETPEVLIDFLRLVQRGLQAQVGVVRTYKGTEFLNQTLHAYFAAEGIQHQTFVARTHEQNGVVKRRNRTLVEAARTMLSAAKFLYSSRLKWGKFEKMKEKGDECIFMGYSNQSRAYRVFNKRTRVIMEAIHVNFNELPLMASDQRSSDPAPKCQTMASDQRSSDPALACQTMASDQLSSDPAPEYRTVTTSNELDLLFSPMFDELLNGSSKVVSQSSTVFTADAPNQHQRQNLTTP
nr:hypothetical protein [Tanacetum cinerariifolium]